MKLSNLFKKAAKNETSKNTVVICYPYIFYIIISLTGIEPVTYPL